MELDPAHAHEHADMALHSVITSAAYSPLALGHLPQPVPNDLPPGLDASVFTFQDAFEDLLVASRGQQLPDIRTRHQQRQLLRTMFPDGEPAWFWMRRLESQRLLRPLDPFARLRAAHQPSWAALHNHLRRMAADVWHQETPDDGPLDLEHFLSGISSDAEQGPSSWDTFLNHVHLRGEHRRPRDKGLASSPDGGEKKTNVVTTEKEHVDWFGYLHKTVTRKTLDAEGNQIASETHVTICPADNHVNNAREDGQDGSVEQRHQPASQNSAESSHWFWK